MRKKVLVTGISGTIGSIVQKYLGKKYELSGLDRLPVDGFDNHVAELSQYDDIRPAFDGKDTVVHLAAEASGGAPWESILPNNIVGTYNVLQACQEAGVRRVVFASTNHVVGYYPEKDDPYKALFEGRVDQVSKPIPQLTTDLLRPDCLYGVSKAFGESLGQLYYEKHGISFIALRIGGVLMKEGWQRDSYPGLAMWLSHRDAAQLIERSIDAPKSVGYLIVYGMSGNSLRIHEIETANSILGYTPQDNAGENLNSENTNTEPYYQTAH